MGGGYTHMCAIVYVHVLIMNLYVLCVCTHVWVYVKKRVYLYAFVSTLGLRWGTINDLLS